VNAWQGLSDTTILFLALAALYLWECTCWLRGDALLLGSGWGACRWLGGRAGVQNERGRLMFCNPLPCASSFICQSWPIVMDHQGLLVPRDLSGRRENRPSCLLPFGEIRSVARDGRKVLVNGIIAALPPTESHADFVVTRLRAVCHAGEDDRQRLIEALFDDMADIGRTHKRLASFRQAARPLQVACTALASYLFVAGPLLYCAPTSPWRQFLWFYLAGFGTLWLHLAARYCKARRTLTEESRRATFGHAIMLLLSPASAMRAAEALSRELLAGIEPLTAAVALCRPADFTDFAERELRAALYPTAGESTEDAETHTVHAWFSAQRAMRVDRAIRLAGLEPEHLLRKPAPTHDAASYCPRCLSQFVVDAGCCPKCAGVSLEPFVETSVAIAPGITHTDSNGSAS
jgi:hypothetical protein